MNDINPPKKLVRTRKGRQLAGVCSGIAEYVGVDATVVRLVFVALAVVTGGLFALVYLAAWAIVPEEGEEQSIAENMMKKSGGG